MFEKAACAVSLFGRSRGPTRYGRSLPQVGAGYMAVAVTVSLHRHTDYSDLDKMTTDLTDALRQTRRVKAIARLNRLNRGDALRCAGHPESTHFTVAAWV